MGYDVVIENGLLFDGTGAPGVVRSVGIKDGRVVAVSDETLEADGARVIDARGKWIVPGFLDCHTHYDAEVIAAPSLSESIRHGVTTITLGSCSISAVLADAEDCSDLFTRVEAIPREQVLPLLQQKKTWSSAGEFVSYLKDAPLGPNVNAFLGHSDMRARVMGLARAVDPEARPSEAEMKEMERLLGDALDHGMLGMSSMTNPWDKLDGDRFRSAQLPSTYATWGEYRRLHAILRERGRILQSAPNLVTVFNTVLFLAASAGGFFRKTLKTTLLTLADGKAIPGLHRVVSFVTRLFNKVLKSDVRWQTLPVPFEIYADGIDLVVFEEFGAGRAALHLADQVERNALMKDEAYRRQFRKDYEIKWSPRVWHRDFHDAHIDACPDASIVGKSFGDVAQERGVHPVDLFLDLVVEHGKKLRWHTLIANHRPAEIARNIQDPCAIIGFADSGAHIRNMAFYSAPLRMLRMVRDAEKAGTPILPMERAVHRLTGELADWLDVDAGKLRVGDRADVVVIDPEALDARLDAYHEAPMEGFGDLMRMVNRSDGTVTHVLVNGRVAYEGGAFAADLGKQAGFGQFLAAGQKAPAGTRAAKESGKGRTAEAA